MKTAQRTFPLCLHFGLRGKSICKQAVSEKFEYFKSQVLFPVVFFLFLRRNNLHRKNSFRMSSNWLCKGTCKYTKVPIYSFQVLVFISLHFLSAYCFSLHRLLSLTFCFVLLFFIFLLYSSNFHENVVFILYAYLHCVLRVSAYNQWSMLCCWQH